MSVSEDGLVVCIESLPRAAQVGTREPKTSFSQRLLLDSGALSL